MASRDLKIELEVPRSMAAPWALILPESAPGLILTGPDHQDRKRWDATEGRKDAKKVVT